MTKWLTWRPATRICSGLLLAATLLGCGDLYSSQELPFKEYADLTIKPACLAANGEPWLLSATVDVGSVAYVQRVSSAGEGIDIEPYQGSCTALVSGAAGDLSPASGDASEQEPGLHLCLVTVVAAKVEEGSHPFTLYIEDGGGLVIARGELLVFSDCEGK